MTVADHRVVFDARGHFRCRYTLPQEHYMKIIRITMHAIHMPLEADGDNA
jgi:hypothetical protein